MLLRFRHFLFLLIGLLACYPAMGRGQGSACCDGPEKACTVDPCASPCCDAPAQEPTGCCPLPEPTDTCLACFNCSPSEPIQTQWISLDVSVPWVDLIRVPTLVWHEPESVLPVFSDRPDVPANPTLLSLHTMLTC